MFIQYNSGVYGLCVCTCRVLGIQKTAYEVLEGLVHLNDNGLVHRMLSPGNILLSDEVLLCGCGGGG